MQSAYCKILCHGLQWYQAAGKWQKQKQKRSRWKNHIIPPFKRINKDYTIYEGESDNQFYFEAGNASNNTVAIDFIEINRVTLKSFNKICYVIKKLKTKHMKKD